MNYFSKMPLNIYLKLCFLLGCCAVLLSTCENPQPNTEQLLAPHPTCKISNTATPYPEGTITPTKEPLYEKQWYLCNTGTDGRKAGIDINVAPVWKKGYGTNPISVGIIDATIDITHPDLAGSIRVEGFAPYDAKIEHGTNVAGLLAARDNGLGIIGVAPRARIYGYGVAKTIPDVANALNSPEHTTIAVYNGSIGDAGTIPFYKSLLPVEKTAIDRVTDDGFYGKGSSLVFAASNLHFDGVSSSDSYLNHHAVITVNAIGADGKLPDINSERGIMTRGYNLWITAPSARETTARMITTYNGGVYKEDFGRTSGAAPLVSGAIALLRSEYPELTWRDVKLILAESARKYDDEERAQYQASGTMYSSATTPQRYSRSMGFGLLDVKAAFALAKDWTLLPDEKTHIATHGESLSFSSTEKANTSTITNTLKVADSDIRFVESVTIEMNVRQESGRGFEEWIVWLTHDDKTPVTLYFRRSSKPEVTTITLLVNSFLGSTADGTWTLRIEKKHRKDNINKITDWKIVFRGH